MDVHPFCVDQDERRVFHEVSAGLATISHMSPVQSLPLSSEKICVFLTWILAQTLTTPPSPGEIESSVLAWKRAGTEQKCCGRPAVYEKPDTWPLEIKSHYERK